MCSLILETSRTNVQTAEKHLLKLTHSGERRHNCDKFEKSFARPCTLKRHMLIHVQSSNKPYTCSQCSYTTSVARQLQGHVRTHSLQKTKKCNKCDYSTIYLSHLKKHLATHSAEKVHMMIQTADKPYKCDRCEFSSMHRRKLK